MKYSRCGANECPVRIHCPTFVDGGNGGNTTFDGAGNGSCDVASPIVIGIPAPPPATAAAAVEPDPVPERRIGTDSVLGTTPLPPPVKPPPAFVLLPPGEDLAPPVGGVGGSSPVAPVVPPLVAAVPVVGTVEVVAGPLCPAPPPPPPGVDAGWLLEVGVPALEPVGGLGVDETIARGFLRVRVR